MSNLGLTLARDKMRAAGVVEPAVDVFSHYYRQLEQGTTGYIAEDSIEPLTDPDLLESVEVSEAAAVVGLATTAIIKLNGGLGTSMGLDKAKSLVPVRDGKTFLDITVEQVLCARRAYGVRLPLLFMNSFRTQRDTLAALERYPGLSVDGLGLDFLQNSEPKLRADDLTPVEWLADPALEWCPPGHGDLYTALVASGVLERLLAAGYRQAFVSNSDNLGASPNATIAGWFAASGAPYAAEICRRTAADRKGGHLAIRKADRQLILRDTAQTAPDEMHFFTDEFQHPYFHTNNLWFDLERLAATLTERKGVLGLPLIKNVKTVDPADATSTPVIQIECAMGAAIEVFEGATAIGVGRDRFVPVKTTNDLLLLQSDAYRLSPTGSLDRVVDPAPLIDLDNRYYKTIGGFSRRFADGVPSVRQATSLTVTGDWTFGAGVVATGDAVLTEPGEPATVAAGTIIAGPGDAPASRPDGWWKSAVVYQIYPRSFADSNGDGVGDIPGITSHLDHLAGLGVDVLWLSPMYTSPQDDNGYDISDYTDIDPLFGTLADLDGLIEQAHARGLKLVMDLVVNHTSDEHPWFVESRDPASAKRDWYIWRPAREGTAPGSPGAEPSGLRSAFSGSAWEYDPASGEYFLHIFSRKQPDLNWENDEVRDAVYAMMRWWVDRGIDGFRMDVINLIAKPDRLIGRTPAPGEPSRDDFGSPRLDEFLAEMNREVGLDRLNLLTVGEMPGATVDLARRVTDPSRHELNMVFTFEHVDLDVQPGGRKWDLLPLSLPALKSNLARWQAGLADAGWNSLYLGNHDQPRAVSRFGDDSPQHRVNSAKTLATVLHMHRGTPYIYQGEELGMTNSAFLDIGQYRDIESVNHHAEAVAAGEDPIQVMHSLAVKSRDNARTPMHWDAGPNAGFTAGEPWLPVHANHVEINAADAVADPASVYHHVRRLIELRHANRIVVDGTFALLLPEHEQLWVLTRTCGDQEILVLANCSSTAVGLPPDAGLPPWAEATVLLATHDGSRSSTLQPWESRILQLP